MNKKFQTKTFENFVQILKQHVSLCFQRTLENKYIFFFRIEPLTVSIDNALVACIYVDFFNI